MSKKQNQDSYTLNETRSKKKNIPMVLKLSSRVSVEFNRQGHIIPDWTTGTIQTIF